MAELAHILRLTVVTQDRKILDTEADEVVLPGVEGYLGVLPGHTPLLTLLKAGELSYRKGGTQQAMVVSTGFAEILPDRVIVLADAAYLREEIDRESAERQRVEAEKALATLGTDDEEFAVARTSLDEATAKLLLAGRSSDH